MHTVHKPKDTSAPAKFGNAGCPRPWVDFKHHRTCKFHLKNTSCTCKTTLEINNTRSIYTFTYTLYRNASALFSASLFALCEGGVPFKWHLCIHLNKNMRFKSSPGIRWCWRLVVGRLSSRRSADWSNSYSSRNASALFSASLFALCEGGVPFKWHLCIHFAPLTRRFDSEGLVFE